MTVTPPRRRLADIARAVLFAPLGFGGSREATRYVGGTTTGAPTTGTYAVRDLVVSGDGRVYLCTAAGTPGTWTAMATKAEVDALDARLDTLEVRTYSGTTGAASAGTAHTHPVTVS